MKSTLTGDDVASHAVDNQPTAVSQADSAAGLDAAAPPVSKRMRPRPAHELSWTRQFRRFLKLGMVASYDVMRFFRHSSAVLPPRTAEAIDPYVVMGYHSVEKGMALPNPRPGFGHDVISRLLVDAERVESEFGGHPSVDVARQALRQYESGIAEGAFGHDKRFADFVGEQPPEGTGGTLSVGREAIHSAAKMDLSDFFKSRYSVRNFAPDEVNKATIEEAVGMARKTPSVCNRQSARVHAVVERDLVTQVLAVQNGNAGFRNSIPAVLVITSDLQKFVSCAERYQGWIDGGLFAMSLCYALHSKGLGTCMLNWSAEIQQDRKLRHVLNLPDSENVIMMMAVGHLLEAFDVAASPRRQVSSLLTFHD